MFGFNNMIGESIDDDDLPGPHRCKLAVKNDLGPKRISHLQFGLLSPAEMQRLAEFQVVSRELFSMPSRTPAVGGCLDKRLGVSDKMSTCQTCKRKLVECAGHFGYIKLALPVFHIGFLQHTLKILQCICKTCSRVLLPEAERLKHLVKMRQTTHDALLCAALFKKLVEKCKKVRICSHCGAYNGTVKKLTGVPTLKIVHERYKAKAGNDEAWSDLMSQLEVAMQLNPAIAAAVTSTATTPAQDLTPTTVLELFKHISDSDCEVLWINPLIGRPENLILVNLLVPPVPIRVSKVSSD